MKDVTDQYEMDTEGVELVSVYDTHNKHLLFVEYRCPPGSSGDGKGVAFFHRRSLEEFTGPEAPRRRHTRSLTGPLESTWKPFDSASAVSGPKRLS